MIVRCRTGELRRFKAPGFAAGRCLTKHINRMVPNDERKAACHRVRYIVTDGAKLIVLHRPMVA